MRELMADPILKARAEFLFREVAPLAVRTCLKTAAGKWL